MAYGVKFRLDFDGQKTLNYNSESVFKFKVPRYADLLNDVYVVINLPDIWSSIYVPPGTDVSLNEVRPYFCLNFIQILIYSSVFLNISIDSCSS